MIKNKNVIFLIVIILLLSVNISSNAQININKTNAKDYCTFFDENVPNWEVGYSWTYKGEIQISENLNFNLDMNEACVVVSKIEDGTYKLNLGGDITGSLDVPNTPFSFNIQKLSGNILFTESNLGLKEIDLIFSGNIEIQSIKYPAKALFKIVSSPARDFMSFPLYAGKLWVNPKCDISIDITIEVFGIPLQQIPMTEEIPESNGTCLSYEQITTGGNTYGAYKMNNGGSSNLYYAPSIGNIILIESEGQPTFELIATNYPTADNPQKPDMPSGPNKGKTDVEYTYTTKTTDPTQDQIKYGWDWDGDMIPDEWTDYYNSDESISVVHTWTQEGTFNVRVKARDASGHESQWSDPLPINIPRISYNSRLFYKNTLIEIINYIIEKRLTSTK